MFTSTVNVSGNGNYNSGNFTPSTAGSYYWVASYSGDVNNAAVAGSCGDVGETSALAQAAPGIVTVATSGTVGAAVHDVATLSGGQSPTGTITFNLYGPSATADCTGTPVFTSTVNVGGNGNYNSGNFTPSTAGSYYWVASYSGDVNNAAVAGSCGDSGETSTLARQATEVTTVASSGVIGDAEQDVATLSGATDDATGTITFNLYGPSATPDCSGTPVFTDTVDVAGNGDYASGEFTPVVAGNYYWTASYSGDANNLPSAEACGAEAETSTLAQQATAITTDASSGIVGFRLTDIATLTGATDDATGTITFNLYGPSSTADCSGTPVFTDTVDVTGAGQYESGGFAPIGFGSYYWTASYSGDVNNLPSDEPCGAPNETSTLEAEGSSSTPPPTPPPTTTPPTHGTSSTGAPVRAELELVLVLLMAGGALLVIGRRRRGARQQ